MAVPQLQLANLGEIFAQNQARQAEMDTMQLQQASALEQMRQEQLARQKQSQLMELARTVDISKPEGARQAFELGLMDLPTYAGVQKSATDMALAQQRTETARIQGETSQKRLELDRQNIQSQIQNRTAQLQLSRAQEARLLRQFKQNTDKTEFEAASKFAQIIAGVPEEQRPEVHSKLQSQYGDLFPRLFEGGYTPEVGVIVQALANSSASQAPLSNVAKIEEDFRRGRLSQQQRDAAIAKATTTKGSASQGPSSTLGKLRADLQAGNITQEEFDAAQKKATTVSGEGSFKEYQYKAAQYGQRMNSASENMKSFENPSVLEKAFQKSGMFGNFAQTPERQMYYQAQREFINAIKRQESGAAVTDSEIEDYAQTYFPQPGDTPEVMQRKRQARERAIAGNKATAGGAWEEVSKAVSAVAESQPTPSGGGQGGGLLKPSGQSAEGKPTFTYGY